MKKNILFFPLLCTSLIMAMDKSVTYEAGYINVSNQCKYPVKVTFAIQQAIKKSDINPMGPPPVSANNSSVTHTISEQKTEKKYFPRLVNAQFSLNAHVNYAEGTSEHDCSISLDPYLGDAQTLVIYQGKNGFNIKVEFENLSDTDE